MSLYSFKCVHDFCFGFFAGGVGGVAFLPEKLACTQEQFGGFGFPAYDVAPLVNFKRQIPPAANPLAKHGVHYGFAGGSNSQFLFQWCVSALCNPCDFWSETFKVLGFFFEEAFGDEHGEIDVSVSGGFDFLVNDFLDFLPNRVGVWANNHAAFDGRVICKFSF